MLEPHPCIGEDWSTTFRKTYVHPQTRTKAVTNIKLTGAECEFDNSMRPNKRPIGYGSGYADCN